MRRARRGSSRHFVLRALCFCPSSSPSQPSVVITICCTTKSPPPATFPQDILPVCFRRPSFCPTTILEPSSSLLLAKIHTPLYTSTSSSHILKDHLLSTRRKHIPRCVGLVTPCLNIMAMCQTPMTPTTIAATGTAPVVSPTLQLETPPPA